MAILNKRDFSIEHGPSWAASKMLAGKKVRWTGARVGEDGYFRESLVGFGYPDGAYIIIKDGFVIHAGESKNYNDCRESPMKVNEWLESRDPDTLWETIEEELDFIDIITK